MTKRQLATRVRYWQKRIPDLGVSHWRLESLKVDDECHGGLAAIRKREDYDSFDMEIQTEYLRDGSLRDMDETIVHELLHLAFRDLDDTIAHAETWMPDATYQDFDGHIDHEREGLVERLARTIVRVNDECGTV